MTTPRHILFPTDFSTCAERAYLHAVLLARSFDARLHVVHVAEPDDPDWGWPDFNDTAPLEITEADIYADLGIPLPPPEALSALDRIDVEIEEVESPRPADAIVQYAEEEDIGLIVMGTHGRTGWRRGVLGSVAETVARYAPCPVLTVRSPEAIEETDGVPPWPPQRLLLAVDLDQMDRISSEGLPLSAQWAAHLAGAYGAPLDIVYALTPRTPVSLSEEEASRARSQARISLLALADAVSLISHSPISLKVTVREGDPVEVIEAVAREDQTHLLVMGSHGRVGVTRVLLGSVAETLMRRGMCPTLVVREQTRDALIVPGTEAEALAR